MEPLVSVSFLTYNNASYVKDALDGMLCQRINFPIEVIVYDDGSTDGTTDILKEYEEKKQEVFKVIYQDKNQASKGVDIFKEYQLPRIKGKYVAICDPIDYWFHTLKFDIQVNYMETNKSCVCAFHPMVIRDESDGGRIMGIDQVWLQGKDVYPDEFLSPSPFCFSKSSMLVRTDALRECLAYIEVEDFDGEILKHFLILHGYFHCFPDIIGVHRFLTSNGFEEKLSTDRDFAVKYHLNAFNWLSKFNAHTKNEYAVLVGAKVQSHIEELNALNALMDYPKLVQAIIETEDKIKNLEELKEVANSEKSKKTQKKYKAAQKEYWSWFINAVNNGINE